MEEPAGTGGGRRVRYGGETLDSMQIVRPEATSNRQNGLTLLRPVFLCVNPAEKVPGDTDPQDPRARDCAGAAPREGD